MSAQAKNASELPLDVPPPPPHVVKILGAAQTSERVGRAFVNGFDDPRTFFPWLADPAEADRFLAA